MVALRNTFADNFKSSKLDATGNWRAPVMREYDDMQEEFKDSPVKPEDLRDIKKTPQ